MSLVVGKQTEHGIYIVSDSKITRDFERINPLLNGISKVFFLDNERCVAFVGHVERAIETAARLTSRDSTKLVIDLLQSASIQGDVSFLVACLAPERKLMFIRRGSTLVTTEGWIGDHAAYSLYREFSDGQRDPFQIYDVTLGALRLPENVPESDCGIYGSMYTSMAAAIGSGESESIGGFVVPVLSEQNQFRFGCYGAGFRKPVDPDLELHAGVWTPINLGDATSGAFSLSFAHIGRGFAVHYSQCNIGILYEAHDNLVLQRNITRNIDEIDFVRLLESRYGSWQAPKMAHQPNHFWRKAQSLGMRGLFSDAAALFSEGIRQASLSWQHKSKSSHIQYDSIKQCLDSNGTINIPQENVQPLKHAFLGRGKCRYYLKQYSAALLDFDDALLLDPDFAECLLCKQGVLKILNAGLID